MSFGAPQWLLGLLVLPALVVLFVWTERTGAQHLRDFVSPRLLPQLAGNVNRFRRILRLGLQLLALALALIGLAQPRWGYTFEDAKRKGIDLFIAVDTSRSMLSNDVQPNRLERVRLATQDLINQLQGDRVGLIAFAGRAFVQAPLTIDYDAVVEAINDLDTKTIPEGGTNISEAIMLADRTYGKSATGNRALIMFTDGEELSGDAVKTAKAASDAGVRIFTVGVGTPEGSLIPLHGEEGDTAFVKDAKGQVVKSKLDENRLREIAEATGGFYLHLGNGPRTMQQLFTEGLAKMQAAEIDVRLSRRPIERYQWPLGAAIIALAISFLISERKRTRQTVPAPAPRAALASTAAIAALLLLSLSQAFAAAPGLDAYHEGKFPDAYQEFQQTLKAHPQTGAADKLQFDSGAAAYKMKDYSKALESFSQALLSPDMGLQSKSHYNLGNTLYEHGETQQSDDKKLTDWTNALQHYEQTLKLEPQNKEAKDNYDYVKKKIEELKKKKQEQPPPQNKQQKNDKQDKQDKQDQQQQKKQDQQQSSQQDQQQKQDQQQQNQQQQSSQQDQKQDQQQQQSQAQNQPGKGENQKPENKQDQSQAKNEQQKNQQPKSGESPSPSPSPSATPQQGQPSPSPGEGKKEQPEQSPTPGEGQNATPSPSPGEGEGSGEGSSPSPTPEGSPRKKLAGEVKGAAGDKSEKPDETAQIAEAESEKDGQLSERQAEALLQSMKDEEARVQLDERRATRRVYNDW